MIQTGNIEGISDIIRFVLEIDKLKAILRKVKPAGEDRYENTAGTENLQQRLGKQGLAEGCAKGGVAFTRARERGVMPLLDVRARTNEQISALA